jgi:glycosyltransferase involved in cell wall biosynthesis
MLRIYAQLISSSKDCASVRLILLGDGSLRGELQNLCQQLGLHFFDAQENDGFDSEAKVYFLGFQQNPYPLISRAQLLLLTSHWEGLPIALLEAMSLGIPGVVSDCSEGIRDLWQLSGANVDDREEGRLGPATPFGVLMPLGNDNSKDVIQWAKEIEKLLRDPPQRNHYAKACRRRASNYGIDHVAQLWNEHLLNPAEH